MFGSSRTHQTTGTRTRRGGFFSGGTSRTGTRRGLFHRADPDRRAGGYKAALHNPNTTGQGRKHAKHELRAMGRGNEAHGHPSLTSRIKHMFGIRSRSSASRTRTSRY
ncbi:hypothetical protein ACEPAF_6510 [Sanghuangporus sanghuang]|uniref:Uncharacterized protein n=1 Tax=Sanghuangporus baumii TaxID=108892 RepID=A0A9Q5N8A7_SANBA|nr:hypothetical protein A7U60_g5358 [Sanghuangporus baumii]